MVNNISVKIVADVTSLQAQLAIATRNTSALSAQFAGLYKQAQATGGITPELAAQFNQLGTQAAAATAKTAALRSELNQGASGFQKYSSALGLVRQGLGAFGISIGAAAIVEFGKHIFDATEQIAHEAEVLGLTTTALQAFQKSGLLAGVDIDTVDTAIRKFNASQGAALAGTAAQADAFKDLGVNASLPADQALPAVARALLSITDVARRSHDEIALFGKGGEELNPVLEQWAQGLDTLTAKLNDMGLMLSDETTQAARDAKRELDLAFGQIEVAWAIPVTNFTGNIADLVEELQKLPAAVKFLEDISGITAYNASHASGGAPAPAPGIAHGGGDIPAGLFGDSTGTPTVLPPKPSKPPKPYDPKAAAQARLIEDQKAQAFEQGNQRRIASEEQTNTFLLEMGQESLGQWKAQAVVLENARYQAELDFLKDKEKADASDKVKLSQDQAQEAQLFGEHTDKLLAIDQQYQQKKKQQDQASLQEFIQAQDERATALTESLDQQYEAGSITAQQKYQTELAFTSQVEAEVLKRLDAEIAGLTQGTKAYEDAMKQRSVAEKGFTQEATKDQQEYVKAEEQAWQPMATAFDQMIDGLISGNQTLGQIFARLAETMAEDWIKQELKQVENTLFAEQAKTQAVIVGTDARAAAESAGAASSSGILSGKYIADIEGAAAKTYADVFAWAAPELGPFAAIPAGAAALLVGAQAALVPSFDVGTNFVTRNTLAMVHQGERIMPAADNSALMAAIGGGGQGGGQGGSNVYLSVNMNVVDGSTGLKFIKAHAKDLAQTVQAHLRYNPSLRSG